MVSARNLGRSKLRIEEEEDAVLLAIDRRSLTKYKRFNLNTKLNYEMATVERLYELYNIISDAEDITSKEAEFAEILTGVKGNAAERKLSSQFIARFYASFPNLQEQSLNSLFDLCEDDDVSIRKQAIKDLPSLCKAKPDIIPKVSDILAQLLQMEDAGEIVIIQNSLVSLFKLEAKGTLTGLFYQIENSEDENVRERCLRFLQSKLKTLGHEVFKPEAEELIMKESKAVLTDASEEEFLLMMGILKELRLTKSLKGYQHMVDLVSDQCNLTQPIDPTNLETLHRLSLCMKQAVPYFSSQIRSTKFVEYLCQEVLPFLNQLDPEKITEGGQGTSSITLDLLRTLAELIAYVENLKETEEKVNTVFTQLLEVMPLPPSIDEATTEPIEESVSLEFSRVECLLYIFHQLAKNHPEFLADNPDRLKDFRSRLQYFARGSHAYQKKLRESLADKKGEELKSEENNIKLIALKTTANINTLIKDLFHQPPSYKSTITLSWKVSTKSASEKRHTPITFDSSPNKNAKTERQIYAPPRDKYSRNAGQYGRGRGRGGFRGYGGFRGGFRRY